MDFIIKEKDFKIINNFTITANKIRQNVKNDVKLKKEKLEFEEIKELLKVSDTKPLLVGNKDVKFIESVDSLSDNIPINALGGKVFDEDKIFSYFNEKTLCLKDFLNANGEYSLGKDAKVPNEDLFRKLIACNATGLYLPDNEECRLIRLYVLFLLSVHTDEGFISACVDFLKRQRFKISGFEILQIYLNFGCNFDSLIISNNILRMPIKFNRQLAKGNGENRFPYYNVEMVADLILYYTNFDLIKKDEELKILIKALTKLTLDPKIRRTRLLSSHSLLVSVLSSQLVNVFGLDDIASCLHLKNEDILNQLEVLKIVHTPISSELHELLFMKTITFILNSNVSPPGGTLKGKYICSVLEKLIEKDAPLFEVYCILQLINYSLPKLTATDLEPFQRDLNNLLFCLEARLYQVKDSVDLIRLKLEVAKSRSLVMNIVKISYPVNFLGIVALSP